MAIINLLQAPILGSRVQSLDESCSDEGVWHRAVIQGTPSLGVASLDGSMLDVASLEPQCPLCGSDEPSWTSNGVNSLQSSVVGLSSRDIPIAGVCSLEVPGSGPLSVPQSPGLSVPETYHYSHYSCVILYIIYCY